MNFYNEFSECFFEQSSTSCSRYFSSGAIKNLQKFFLNFFKWLLQNFLKGFLKKIFKGISKILQGFFKKKTAYKLRKKFLHWKSIRKSSIDSSIMSSRFSARDTLTKFQWFIRNSVIAASRFHQKILQRFFFSKNMPGIL